MVVFCLLLSSGAKAETIHQWEVFTLSFKTTHNYLNPYAQIPVKKGGDLLHVAFDGITGQAKGKKLVLTGFWAGGSEWRVNFAAPYTGEWRYKSASTDRKLNGKEGKFTVIPWTDAEKKANPTRRGFVKVMQAGSNAGHYFEYSDGHPFLWIGDTWWNWTKMDIHFDTFKKLVDDRAEKGFNIGQLFVPGNAWKKENSLLDTTYSVLDASHMQKVEEMIRYANSKGITMWIHGWWGRKDLDKNVGKEKMIRWWRYLVHRFSAYNVIWVLAGEYNMYNYGGLGLDFWNNLGTIVKQEDPYQRITSVHCTPPFWDGGKDAPQWTTGSVLNNEPWLDYNQCQVGHGKFANEMIPQCVSYAYNLNPVKPIVVTEPWYEFSAGAPPASDIRFGAWSAILSGAAGHSYGGGKIWLADVPESPEKGVSEPHATGGTTLDYEGAKSMGYLAAFFKRIDWWKLAPHPELVTEYPQPFCLADPGKEYVIYLRYGGVAKVQLGSNAIGKQISYCWFDPATGKYQDTKTVAGDTNLEFKCPISKASSVAENKDWVLFIKEE